MKTLADYILIKAGKALYHGKRNVRKQNAPVEEVE